MLYISSKVRENFAMTSSQSRLMARNGCMAGTRDSFVPADWTEISIGRLFSLTVPKGTTYKPERGIDSTVGTIATSDCLLSFDYGAYSNPLNRDSGDQHYRIRDTKIDGRRAKIVRAYAPHRSPERPYFIGVHFLQVKSSPLGPIKLTVSCNLKSEKDFPVIEKIFGTIHFQ